jgi:DNA polymerase III sliding clamp (beta) subunit (PCNA family)
MTSVDTVAATSMRVVCGKDELAEKLQVAGRGVSTRTAVQILAGIMLRAAGGRLHLSSTDMEISVRDSLEAQVEEEGAVVVPGRLLVDIVRLLPAGEVLPSRLPQGRPHLRGAEPRLAGPERAAREVESI